MSQENIQNKLHFFYFIMNDLNNFKQDTLND